MRRQITAIGFSLRLVSTGEHGADPEVLDPILSDQLRLCRDALVRYGGTVSGELGDALVVLFGFPTASDADARRAVRTVLELAEDIRRRSERLAVTHRLELQFRIGMHTGLALVSRGQIPTGVTPTIALNLAGCAGRNDLGQPGSPPPACPLAEIEPGGVATVCGERQPIPIGSLLGERRGEAAAPGGFRAPTLFVGRRTELGLLKDQLRRAGSYTTPQAALITGEAGIGKSRLVREFINSARETGHTVLSSAASPSCETPPWLQ